MKRGGRMSSAMHGLIEADAEEKARNYSVLGEAIQLTARPAVVVSDPKIWSETRVSSSGGGGYVHPQHGGHVKAPTVHSTSVDRSSYFVKDENQREVEIRDGVACRTGHRIYAVFMTRPGKDANMLVATFNRDTHYYSRIVPWGHFFANPICAAAQKLERITRILLGADAAMVALTWLFGRAYGAPVTAVAFVVLVVIGLFVSLRTRILKQRLEREFPAAVVDFLNSLE